MPGLGEMPDLKRIFKLRKNRVKDDIRVSGLIWFAIYYTIILLAIFIINLWKDLSNDTVWNVLFWALIIGVIYLFWWSTKK